MNSVNFLHYFSINPHFLLQHIRNQIDNNWFLLRPRFKGYHWIWLPCTLYKQFFIFFHCKPSFVRFCKSLHICYSTVSELFKNGKVVMFFTILLNCFLTYKLNTEQQKRFQSFKFSCNICTNKTELRG